MSFFNSNFSTMAEFSDHFSAVSSGYAAFRPTYPDALIDALTDVAPSQQFAWDCGCGTGQVSVPLAQRFQHVHATDASAAQIDAAERHERITYEVREAHDSGLPDNSVGLITVAQALHWFDVNAFHAEATRVLMPHGVIAEWSYALLSAPAVPAITAIVTSLDERLHAYWPPERRHVDNGYADLDFPFTAVDLGHFSMEALWSKQQLLGYLGTWSAVTRYREETGDDPLPAVAAALDECWGSVTVQSLVWPLTLRVGQR